MKKFNPKALIFGFFSLATFASLMGAVSGSLAWYIYGTRATLLYSGTSGGNDTQLQIGLVSSVQIPDFLGADYITEITYDGDANYYYFVPAGDGLTTGIIGDYLSENNYATNELYPLTSGSFSLGGDFSLKEAPSSDEPNNIVEAGSKLFAQIPFVFRAIHSGPGGDAFVANQEVWITSAKTQRSSAEDGNAYQSLRLHFERDESYTDGGFILNPSAEISGSTKVGGLLDFGNDEYYDCDGEGKEVIYGEYEDNDGLSASGYSGLDEIVDVNGVGGDIEETSTFLAKHQQGARYYESLEACGIGQADYYALSNITPQRVGGVLNNFDSLHPTSICVTADETGHYIGRVTMTIYLEGWDFSLTDKEIGHLFDVGLTFEINAI